MTHPPEGLDALLTPSLTDLDDAPGADGQPWWTRPVYPSVPVMVTAIFGFVPGSLLLIRNFYALRQPGRAKVAMAIAVALAALVVAGFHDDMRLLVLALVGPFNLPAIVVVAAQAHRQTRVTATLPVPWWLWPAMILVGTGWVMLIGVWLLSSRT